MTKNFGFPQSDWDAAKREAHTAMVAAARSTSGTITYSDLATKITAIRFEPDARMFHSLLGQISEAENEQGRGMLSVVVVQKTGENQGQPGEGFFRLARELGRDVRNRLKFWTTEFELVRAAWLRKE
jgi:hypothetical protein